MTEREQSIIQPDEEPLSERQRNLEKFRQSFGEKMEILANISATTGEMFTLDPTMMELGERSFEELNPDEQRVMKKEIFIRLGLDPKNLRPHFHQTYETKPLADSTSQGEQIHVFESPKSEFKGVGLHIIHYEDGGVRWVMGPIDSKLE